MKRIDQIIAGLQIISKYDESGYSVCAEHDELYAGESVFDKMSDEDKAAMAAADWDLLSDINSFRFTL